MISDLLLLAIPGAALLGGITFVKSTEQKRLRSRLVAYRLSFPRNLEAEEVTRVLAGFSGLLLPWWKRWLTSPFVALEIHASNSGIRHYLVTPEEWSQAARNILQASVPAVRFEPVGLPTVEVRTTGEYRLSSQERPLLIDAPGLSAKTLASLQPLEPKETIVVQWLLTPHAPIAPVKVAATNPGPIPLFPSGPADSEAVGALRKKHGLPLLLATGRIGVRGSTGWGELRLLRQVEAAWHETRAPGVHLRRRTLPSRWVSKSIALRRAPLSAWPATLTSEELTGFIGWPIEVVGMPGLILGGCRQIPPSPLIPTIGTVMADSTYPGDHRPMALNVDGRLRHVHLLGPTGVGKSTLLVQMAISDLEAGHGVVLLDPKGDLVQQVLERVPERRRRDIVILDPADTTRPVGLNPLRSATGASAEVVVENLVGLFKSLYRHSWGPRLDDILRAALLTLAGSEGATLCEVPLILTDPNYRRRLVGPLDDPVGLESFWGWYEALSDAERQTVVGPVLNKVRAFTMRPTVRSIIGQSTPLLDLRDVLASGKVLLCSLASGLLGEEAASLMGALIVAELWHATTARAGVDQTRRRPVMAYLDEFQHFVHLPTPMPSMLAEARGLGLGMTLAHQHLDQLGDEARHAVLANTRSRVVFQLPAGDARIMAREMGTILSADDLQGLGAFEVVCQLFAAGTTQAPATGKTRGLGPVSSDADGIRVHSRDRYGVDREVVELTIRERQAGGSAGGFGRRDRPRRAQ
jgi:energy-coupling factor transporter ATP-binding protein EcfA2